MKTTKLLEKRIEKNLYDLGENKNILDMTSKAQFDYFCIIHFESLFSVEHTIRIMMSFWWIGPLITM